MRMVTVLVSITAGYCLLSRDNV